MLWGSVKVMAREGINMMIGYRCASDKRLKVVICGAEKLDFYIKELQKWSVVSDQNPELVRDRRHVRCGGAVFHVISR